MLCQVREKVYVLGGHGSQTGPVGAYGDPQDPFRIRLLYHFLIKLLCFQLNCCARSFLIRLLDPCLIKSSCQVREKVYVLGGQGSQTGSSGLYQDLALGL